MVKEKIKKILQLLTQEYGNKEWNLKHDPVAVLVQTILSQNTSDRNSDRAFSALKNTFASWDSIASAKVGVIAAVIKSGGLAQVKAGYIKQSLTEIKNRHGRLELTFLKNLTREEARNWLIRLPGVGIKTTNCVLLFSLGMPALPVDTHVFRVSKRLRLIDNKMTISQAHAILENMVQPEMIYSFHILLIEHGRKICKAQRPLCEQCVLGGMCPANNQYPEQEISGIKKSLLL